MSILDRINLLVRSNVNEMLSSSNTPDRALDRSIGEMESSIREARVQLRTCERNEEQLQRKWSRSRESALGWEDKAMEALRNGDEGLAREHLVHKRRFDEEAQDLRAKLEQQQEYIADLTRSLDALRVKMEAAQNHRRSIRSHLDDEGRRSGRGSAAPQSGSASQYTFPSFSDSGDAPPPRRSGGAPSRSNNSPRRGTAPLPSRPRSGDRRAFVFDDDLRRDYPEEVFGAAEPFEAFSRMEDSINRSDAAGRAEAELSGFDDPLRDDLEDRFRGLSRQHESQSALDDLKRRQGRDDARPQASPSPRPASPRSSSDIDDIRRQLAEDMDL